MTAAPAAHPAHVLSGVAASSGRARGPLFVVQAEPRPQARLGPDAGAGLAAAAERAAAELRVLAAQAPPESRAILEAQALMVLDPALRSAALAAAESQPLGAAVTAAAEAYAQRLEALADPYLKERATDVREAGRRLLAALGGGSASRLAGLQEPAIVVAHELAPADTLSVDPRLLLGLVTEVGGRTSHAAIVARELGIPALLSVPGAVAAAGGRRWAEIDTAAQTLTFLERRPLAEHSHGRTAAAPGRCWQTLMANVSSAGAARVARAAGARGIGLFRTEMLFLGRERPMDADEQAAVYSSACAAMAPHPVVVRCLDLGSDKQPPYLERPREPNPALGRRGLRLWLEHEELWRPQAAALVRTAAEHPNLEVMFPMVGAPEELAEARARMQAAARGGRLPRLGMMVELPAAVVGLDAFAGIADFISLGTNDLTQYALGIDRELDWPPYLAEWSPGVLRLIEIAVASARRLGMESAVCGELAGSTAGAVFLAGIGVDTLSMAAEALPTVAAALSRLGRRRCHERAARALAAGTAAAALAAL